MKTPESLWSAIRQYRHSLDNSPSVMSPRDGFVIAFDEVKTIELVTRLEAEVECLRYLLHTDAWTDKGIDKALKDAALEPPEESSSDD